VREDQWGDLDLECLHKACQAAVNDRGLFTDTGVDDRGENEQQGEHDSKSDARWTCRESNHGHLIPRRVNFATNLLTPYGRKN